MNPDYGLDAPGVVRNLALGGLAALVAAIAVQFLPFHTADRNIASAWLSVTAAVLKRGGRIALLDFARTREYVRTLREAGWTDVGRSQYSFRMFPPARTVRGNKP